MKKPEVNYRDFRFSRINEAQFKHVKLLGGWIAYFILYFLTENLIPAAKCHPIHCWVDDMIPFNEYFLIFYCSWFLIIFGSLLYTILYDVKRFEKLQIFIMVTQFVAMAVYIIYPSRQDLRPETFERQNILTALMTFIYRFDTSTGVCPSLHVGYSMGILSVGWKNPKLSLPFKLLMTAWMLMICISVCFVKQHSFLDVLWALPLSLLAEIVTYGKDWWLPKFKRKRA